ncbi:MAG: hypothetical protein VX070_00620, partial [Bacteroidota bacterium]|nr:hypothetical protein [Bacteroidota bacterium]
CVHPTPTLYYINFAKNQKNSESTHNGLKQQEIRKCPLVTLNPKKKLRNIFKVFFQKLFESYSESSGT